MTSLVGSAQNGVLLVIALAAFAFAAFALVDALRRPSGAFPAAGKRTKTFWVALLAVATAIGFVSLPLLGPASMPGLLGIVSVVVTAVYMADVRPAVRQHGGRRGPRRDDHRGPYGPW